MNFEDNETLSSARARNVRDAPMEDIGRGDWTARLLPEDAVAAAMQRAPDLHADVDIQIEVEDLQELRDALDAGAASILLDDFTLDDVRRAVDVTAGRAVLEVSGEDVCAVDLSMRVRA